MITLKLIGCLCLQETREKLRCGTRDVKTLDLINLHLHEGEKEFYVNQPSFSC